MVLGGTGGGGLHVRGRVRGRLARDRLGGDGRAGEAVGLLRVRDLVHDHVLDRLALDLEPARLALREGHAGLRRIDGRALSGCARRPRRRADPRPADRQVRDGWAGEPDPRPQHPVCGARHAHPLVRVVRLQPGLDAVGRLRRLRLLRVRRAHDEHRRGGGRRLRHVRRLGEARQARHLDDAERRARGSGGDHGGVRVRRAVGGDRDRRRFRRDRGLRCHLRRADRDRRPDRRGRGARHVGCLGHDRDRPVRGAGSRAPPRDRPGRSRVHRARSIRSASNCSASSRSARSRSRRPTARSG